MHDQRCAGRDARRALGRYLDAVGERTAGVTIRAAVPVNLRSGDEAPPDLGNRFGLAFVDLPIGIEEPLQRLYAVHGTMQALKGSPEALVTYGLLSLIGSLPEAVEIPRSRGSAPGPRRLERAGTGSSYAPGGRSDLATAVLGAPDRQHRRGGVQL